VEDTVFEVYGEEVLSKYE